jgi:hypothetical protein
VSDRVQAERGGQCGPGEICKEGQCQDLGVKPYGGEDSQRGSPQISDTEAEGDDIPSKFYKHALLTAAEA